MRLRGDPTEPRAGVKPMYMTSFLLPFTVKTSDRPEEETQ
jgi:hypothetical protein